MGYPIPLVRAYTKPHGNECSLASILLQLLTAQLGPVLPSPTWWYLHGARPQNQHPAPQGVPQAARHPALAGVGANTRLGICVSL